MPPSPAAWWPRADPLSAPVLVGRVRIIATSCLVSGPKTAPICLALSRDDSPTCRIHYTQVAGEKQDPYWLTSRGSVLGGLLLGHFFPCPKAFIICWELAKEVTVYRRSISPLIWLNHWMIRQYVVPPPAERATVVNSRCILRPEGLDDS